MTQRVLPVGRRAVLTGAAGAMVPRLGGAAVPTRLISPVDVEARRKLIGKPLSGYGCHAPPAPVIDLSAQGAYVDKSFSIVDAEKLRRLADAVRPLGAFCWQVTQNSDLFMMSRPMRPEPAACMLGWMDSWAGAGAMLGRFDTADAQHHRRWTLCGLGLAYLKMRDAPGLDPAARRRVEQWFVRLADAASAYYGTWSRGSYSNHIGWWALSLAVAGVAANDHGLFDHALSLYDALVSDIQPDGTLPLEMARKSRALGYHVFALTPLVMLAEIGTVNGVDLYGAHDGAIHRLARRVLAGFADPDWFAARAGAPQEKADDKGRAFSYVWAEIYYPRFPDPALGQKIVANRPMFYPWLGGSVTYTFGSAALPFPA